MLLERAEGITCPGLGDQRSFPEVKLVENLKNYMPFEGNVNGNATKTPGRLNLNSVSE